MRLIHLYLIAYFVLLAGAGIALWQSGALARIPVSWLVLTALIAVGLGVGVALTSARSSRATRT